MIAEAHAAKDELASLDAMRRLGAERYASMLAEADALEAEGLALVHAAKPSPGGDAEALLEGDRGRYSLEEQRVALRGTVQAVFVRSGDGPLADRVDVVGHDVELGVPTPGRRGVARRWIGLV